MTVSYTSNKLSTCFNMIDEIVFNHENDTVYYAKCPEESCLHDCACESGRRVLQQVKYYNGRHLLPYL